ncbi:MAG TPA: hypothetical protein DCG53_04305 [Syntrophus sp. (in: bacteria)]|nr:hypothetical protein [Syntrophus sp. (in: bacteria)]
MKKKPCLIVLLLTCLVLAAGCASDIQTKEPVFMTSYSHSGDELNRTQSVRPEQNMLSTAKGPRFHSLILKNQVKGSTMGLKCNLEPQELWDVMEDDEYFYYFSDHNRSKAFYVLQAPHGHDCPCGLRISKSTPQDINMAIKLTPDKTATVAIDKSVRPEVERIEKINIYDPNFLRRSVKFVSYEDGILFLLYKEEIGTPNFRGPDGTTKMVEPLATEEILQFNIGEAKDIEIKEAKLKIIQATPEKLVYEVVRALPAN